MRRSSAPSWRRVVEIQTNGMGGGGAEWFRGGGEGLRGDGLLDVSGIAPKCAGKLPCQTPADPCGASHKGGSLAPIGNLGRGNVSGVLDSSQCDFG